MPYFRFDFGVPDAQTGFGPTRPDVTVGEVRDVLRSYGGDLEGFSAPAPRAGFSVIASGPHMLGEAGIRIADIGRVELYSTYEIDQPPTGLVEPGVDYAAPPFYVWCSDCQATVPLGECPHT